MEAEKCFNCSTVRWTLPVYDAMNNKIVDMTWQPDYGKLYEFLCGDDAVARLWGSPPPGDSFWKMIDRKGFNTGSIAD